MISGLSSWAGHDNYSFDCPPAPGRRVRGRSLASSEASNIRTTAFIISFPFLGLLVILYFSVHELYVDEEIWRLVIDFVGYLPGCRVAWQQSRFVVRLF